MDGDKNGLVARNGHTLVVGIVARISGCKNQKEISLEDQEDHAKEVVSDYYKGPVEYRVIATKGKGERLDRPELAQVEAMLRTRELDVLVCEDIGRLIRGLHAAWLCGIAVDHGTRVLSPNDGIDTNEDGWEPEVIDACKEHVGHNVHTSKRLKHKLMNRFVKGKGATPCPIFGYIKPPGAKTFDDWHKDPAAEPIYAKWLRLLKQNPICSTVDEWLNKEGVPTGKYARRDTWDSKMVRRVTRNPLLKGMPARGFKHTVKHHETGRRLSVRNPKGPKFVEYPHLAFWSSDDFDQINAILDAKNKGCGRKPSNGTDPLFGVPRKRTRFPGQYACCIYCGRNYVWGGNGMKENLMCSGSREWKCWNSIGFNGQLAAERISEAIMAELYRLEGIDAQFHELVREASQPAGAKLTRRWEQLQRDEASQALKEKNLAASMGAYGPLPWIAEELANIKVNQQNLVRERRELEGLKNRTLCLPASVAELRQLLEQQFKKLAIDSPEFGDFLRQLVPQFHVQLVRMCDGGHLLPQACVKLDLGGSIPDLKETPGLMMDLALDLFEPPQRERIRLEAVRLAATGLNPRQIAPQLSEKATATAVQNALALDRTMRELGTNVPYVLVCEPPSDYSKLRRHRNPRYRFAPLDGYPRLPS